MERLTKKYVQIINGREEIQVVLPTATVQEAVNRLAELEDKLENGTLVKPPCKVGDTVYCVIQPDDEEPYVDDTYKCESLRYYNGEWEITPNLDGWWWTIEKVCATREEAEKRLEELKL